MFLVLQIPAFHVPGFTDSGFSCSWFYRFRLFMFLVLQIPAFHVPGFTDSGFSCSWFYRFRLFMFLVFSFLVPFPDSPFLVLQIAVTETPRAFKYCFKSERHFVRMIALQSTIHALIEFCPFLFCLFLSLKSKFR